MSSTVTAHVTQSTPHPDRQTLIDARRVVIKVGTNVVMRDDGRPAMARLHAIAESIAELRGRDRDVVLVSSGAIGIGVQRLGLPERPQRLDLKQACAAVGQGRLMGVYADAFDRLDLVSAQVLLTEDDFADAERYHNLRATLNALLAIGAVPIVNENDTVSTLELERPGRDDGVTTSRAPVFGDNDKLSALIAAKVDADLLILLSDVDGLYDADPRSNPGAMLIPRVTGIDDTMRRAAGNAGSRGRGGMATKLDAAALATAAGVTTVVANGRTPAIIDRICRGELLGTVFTAGDTQ